MSGEAIAGNACYFFVSFADRLISAKHTAPGAPGLMSASGDLWHSASMFFTYADHNRSFEAIGGWTAAAVTGTGQGEPEEARAIFVTKGVLEALGGARGPALRRREVLRPARWT